MAAKKKANTNEYGKAPTNIDERPFYEFNLDDDQKKFVNAILNSDNTVVFCNAKAGTGKTTLAIGTANILVKHGEYDGIVYICSAYGESKQGYLPGSITEKSEVYFEPAYQAMIECNMNPNTCVNTDSMVNQKYGDAYVTLLTHTFLRGTNLKKKVIIPTILTQVCSPQSGIPTLMKQMQIAQFPATVKLVSIHSITTKLKTVS